MSQIIKSLLDIDRYKLTMSQFVFRHYPDVIVKYAFTNRTKDAHAQKILVYLIPYIKEEIKKVQKLRLTFSEFVYLTKQITSDGTRIFKADYLDYLSYLELPDVNVFENNEELQIEVEDKWAMAMWWETIILAIVSELYGRHSASEKYIKDHNLKLEEANEILSYSLLGYEGMLDKINKPYYEESAKRLNEKIKTLKHYPTARFFDFSTRRRFSQVNQEKCVSKIAESFHKPHFGISQFMGTSNEYLAMKYNIKAGGTLAHEMFSTIAGLNDDDDKKLINSQYEFLRQWNKFYGYDLSVTLTDTFGSKSFLENCPQDIAEMYSFREDSSIDLYEYTEDVLSLYKKYNIDVNDRVIVHSNGLDVSKVIEIDSFSKNKINKVYGIGTNIGADVGNGYKHLSIVIKAVSVNNKPIIKLSDNLAKAIGDPDTINLYKKVFGYVNEKTEEQVY